MSTEHTPSEAGPRTGPATRGRRNTVVGVGAGLLAGGAIGLMAVAPSFTSAASDDVADSPSVVVEQDADTTVTEDEGAADRLRELLQALVDDGTITATQADAVADHLIEHRPERGERGEHGRHGRLGGPGRDGEVVAGLLGIDTETLRDELMAGSSIADIAEANGVDVQTVIDALVDEAAGHLDLAVEDGRLTEDEAADKLAEVTERITARVNGEGPLGRR